jgi:four helix bundle protein
MEKLDERTYKFALRTLKLVDALSRTMKGEVLGRQVLRSGTSVGANVEEAYAASSKRDFTNKMSIALKEARETHFWLRLIRDSGLVSAGRIDPLVQEAFEIKLILGKTVATSRKTSEKEKVPS